MHKIIKKVFPIVIAMNCDFCFAQIEELRFIIDTSTTKYDVIGNQYNYYNNEIISCKTFYSFTHFCDYSMYPIHFEFTLLKNNKYYCIEYDEHGNRLNEGVAKKESKPYDEFIVPIIDSNGNTIDNKKMLDYYKLCKDEFWREDIDSGWRYNYSYGKYYNGQRDSIWIIAKRGNVEREILYKDGKIIKDEVVNLTGTVDNRIADVLIGRWELTNPSFSTLPLTFKPDASRMEKMDYVEFYKNGTYALHFYLYFKPEEHGKWKLIDNNTIIKLMPESGKLRIQNLEIEYISKYGLNATFSSR